MIDISNRPDFQHIVDVIPQNSRVLDLGCGDGSLLAILKKNKILTQKMISESLKREDFLFWWRNSLGVWEVGL